MSYDDEEQQAVSSSAEKENPLLLLLLLLKVHRLDDIELSPGQAIKRIEEGCCKYIEMDGYFGGGN